MRGWALAALLWATPVQATIDAWPALFDVARVPPGDALNIRAGPGTSHAVIGTLDRAARDIEVIETTRDERWGRVNAGEGTGWVGMAFLDRQPGQWEGAIPPIAACFGTEPFWRLRMDDDWRMETPEGPLFEASAPDLVASLSHRGRFAAAVETEGAVWTLSLLDQGCSDGMTSRRYGFEALLVGTGPDTTLFTGCCSLAP